MKIIRQNVVNLHISNFSYVMKIDLGIHMSFSRHRSETLGETKTKIRYTVCRFLRQPRLIFIEEKRKS